MGKKALIIAVVWTALLLLSYNLNLKDKLFGKRHATSLHDLIIANTSNFTPAVLISEYMQYPDKIKKFADSGDLLSAYTLNDYSKSPDNTAFFQYMYGSHQVSIGNTTKGLDHIKQAARQENFLAYKYLIYLVANERVTDNDYCQYINSGYKLFGIDIIGELFINSADSPKLMSLLNKCKVGNINVGEFTSPSTILTDDGSEQAQIILALRHINNGNTQKTVELLSQLASSEDEVVASNANACLSYIYYNGIGVAKSRSTGNKYIKKARRQGFLYVSDKHTISLYGSAQIFTNMSSTAMCMNAYDMSKSR